MSKKKRRRLTVLWTILIVLLLAVVTVIVLGMRRVASYAPPVIEQAGQAVHAAPTPTPRPASASVGQELTQTLNLLLLGIDNTEGLSDDARGNADGIILATINPHTKELVFTSFMRDTRVRVRDSGYDKLTNVFHTGSLELLREVMEQSFDLSIDYSAMFTYDDVVEIVDAVGGVEAEISAEEIYFMESKIKDVAYERQVSYEDNALSVDQAGKLTLNGVQAAAYCRIRPADGGYDAGRTERTRNVISQVLLKAFQLPAAERLQFASVFFDKVVTDVPEEVFLSLAANASEIRKYKQVSDRIPIDGSYESGNTGSGYYVIPDFDVNIKHLQDSIYRGIHE